MQYVLTDHATTVIAERRIDIMWIEQALESPDRTEADLSDGDLEHRLAIISERDGRVLRVIINTAAVPARIVTAYFDRGMRNKI